MALFEGSELKFYRYQVAEFYILVNGETLECPTHELSDISIEEDYESSVYPVFKVEMILPEERYYLVMKNKTTVKFKIRIQKYYVSPGNNDRSMVRDYVNDTFSLIMDDEDFDDEMPDQVNRSTTEDTDSFEMRENAKTELYLYRDEVSSAMKKQTNEVLNGVNLTTAVGLIASNAGLKNILMSPMENQQTYSQLILPPLTVHKAIQYLDSQYGFYKSGAVIFFGLKTNYILNFKGGCTAYENGEYQQTTLLVSSDLGGTSLESGMVMRSGNQYYVYWKASDVKVGNQSITNDVLYGNNVNVVDSSTTGITKAQSTAVTTKGVSNTATIKNETENQWMSNTYVAQTNSNNVVLSGQISNVDLDAFTPNKKYQIVFEDTCLTNKYMGIYFLTRLSVQFVNTGGVNFNVVINITLKQVSSKSSESETFME